MDTTEIPPGNYHPVTGCILGVLTFIGMGLVSTFMVYACWVAWFTLRAKDSAGVFIKLVFFKPVAKLFGFEGPSLIGNPMILECLFLIALALSLWAGIRIGLKYYRPSPARAIQGGGQNNGDQNVR